jgi:hypothetical protein
MQFAGRLHWKTYLRKLAAEEGVEIDNDDDLRRFDQQRRRKGEKKVTNAEWESKTDPEARIGKMKNARTHLNYKAEHDVDLDSEFIIQAEVHHGDAADTQNVMGNLVEAQVKLDRSFENIEPDDSACGVIQQAVADKDYHSNEVTSRNVRVGSGSGPIKMSRRKPRFMAIVNA